MLRKAQNRTLPTSPSSRGRRFCAQSRDKEFLANLARQFLDELNAKNIYKWNKLEDLYGISSSAFKATKYGTGNLEFLKFTVYTINTFRIRFCVVA